jgi:hypothetical protein
VLSDEISVLDNLNFSKGSDQILILYTFSNISLEAGETKILTKNSTTNFVLEASKIVVGTLKGLSLKSMVENNTEMLLDGEISLYPNPTTGLLNLSFSNVGEIDYVSVKVFNLVGAAVWSSERYKVSQGHVKSLINLDNINNGIYFVVIEALKNGQVLSREVRKIIINK